MCVFGNAINVVVIPCNSQQSKFCSFISGSIRLNESRLYCLLSNCSRTSCYLYIEIELLSICAAENVRVVKLRSFAFCLISNSSEAMFWRCTVGIAMVVETDRSSRTICRTASTTIS